MDVPNVLSFSGRREREREGERGSLAQLCLLAKEDVASEPANALVDYVLWSKAHSLVISRRN